MGVESEFDRKLREAERAVYLRQFQQVWGQDGVFEVNAEEAQVMGLVDTLKAEGWTPTPNQDGTFEVLKGHYRTSCQVLRKEPATETKEARIVCQLYVEEVLEGTHVDTTVPLEKRRRFFSYYNLDADGLKKLLNDTFTAGVTLDTTSDEALEASFANAIGQPVYVRAWGWTPDKDRQGNLIPESERQARQQFVIKSQTAALKDVAKGTKKKAGDTPF